MDASGNEAGAAEPVIMPKADADPTAKAVEYKKSGNKHLLARRFGEAIDEYTKGIEVCNDPEVVGPILGNRSQAYRRSGDFKAALEDANRAVSIFPSYARAHLRKAYALRELKDWVECQKCIETAFSMNLSFKGDDEKNMDILLKKCKNNQKQAEERAQIELIMAKLKGKWNGAIPAELGGGSQELDFKSERKVILTVPARQMDADLKLDVTKDPMWMDITIKIPTEQGLIPHVMPHLFRFNEDNSQIDLMGPEDHDILPGRPTRRASRIDKESKSYVKFTKGAASATPEEKKVMSIVDELKGKGDEDKMIRLANMLSKRLCDAMEKDGFKFEEPQPHWPEEMIKEKCSRMLEMSRYIFLLEKHFGQTLHNNLMGMVKGTLLIRSPKLKSVIVTLRQNMVACGMHKDEPAQPPSTPPQQSPSTADDGFQNHMLSDKQTEEKRRGSETRPKSSNVSLILVGAAAVATALGALYFFIGGRRNKKRSSF
ncbi:hypothetical protein AAMO2058_001524700 [Amorphochlora amoebiformis]|uniref:Uncharacterized protein n=1 Tax=Amorphochlora amoebiformis TaxID=1561963 RepID=A0A7S0CT58_9EUKA|mmetsp:Transcript_13114/g.20800  ORF Transcript_13114/g.20800 Transcript_13114/m.20800 type:complete len:486 (+) Transcript_13114:73-1530(+)